MSYSVDTQPASYYIYIYITKKLSKRFYKFFLFFIIIFCKSLDCASSGFVIFENRCSSTTSIGNKTGKPNALYKVGARHPQQHSRATGSMVIQKTHSLRGWILLHIKEGCQPKVFPSGRSYVMICCSRGLRSRGPCLILN